MKKNVTYIAREQFEALIAESGLPTSEKKGWTRVDGQSGRRLYVPKTKRVGRVDAVGLSSDGLTALGEESFGAVTHQLDMSGSEADILAAFALALEGLRTLAAVERPAKEPAAPKAARKAKGTEQGIEAAPTSREGRIELIRKVAEQHGVAVSDEEATSAE
jgi:hypothetical protein